jgi:hypothetical protein
MIQTIYKGDYTSSSVTTHGQMKGLPHNDARHGTVEMVDASDEDGSSLSFNSGDVVESSRCPPSSWRPPLGLAMISPEYPPQGSLS